MKILLLAPHPFFQQRGTPIAERMLLAALAAHGHDLEVLTFAEGEDPGIPGCRVRRIPALPFVRGVQPGFSWKKLACDLAMLVALLRLARRGRYDLVHAVEESVFMALLVRWLFGVPYIYDMDSGLARQMIDRFRFLRGARRFLEGIEGIAVRGSVATLAVCRSLEEQARLFDPDGLVSRIEDVSLLGEEADDAAGLENELPPAGGPLVMYVGNLQAYQGIDLLLESFQRALREVPAARLAVIGGDEETIRRYRERCRELRVGGSVHFLGPRPLERLGAYLSRATVLVSPRIQGDNTPMKIYSYLASGRPVLATRLPTHTQVLSQRVARLVEPEPEAMGRDLAELLQDRELRERLGAAARAHAQREFTPEAFERKLLGFYASVEERIREETCDGETAAVQAGHQGHR